MRRGTGIQLLDNGRSVEISHLSPDPQIARAVAARLSSLIVEASTLDRSERARISGEFLDAQVADLGSRLLRDTAERRSTPDVRGPAVEVRDLEYEQAKSNYHDLLMKREHLRIATALERYQLGEQFKLVESPLLPEVPIRPDRRLFAEEGAGAGFMLGVTMMAAGRGGWSRRLRKAQART
jgi:uncharacterized protein involved in exopolysaccharide biosynthesis